MTIIDRILLELSAKVDGGKPNLKNNKHLGILAEVLDDLGWTLQQKSELIGNLRGIKGLNSNISKPKISKPKINKQDIVDFYIRVGEILSEASIHADKYPVGHQVTWSSSGEAAFTKKLPSGSPMINMPAEKAAPTDDAIEVFQSDSGVEFYLKDSSNTYHIKGTSSTVSSWFKHFSGNDEFKLNTAGKESAALLGMYMDAKGYLDKLNALNSKTADEKVPEILGKFKSEVRSTFGNGKDWTNHDILGKLDTASVQNLIQLAAIASGMQKFKESLGIGNWNIVHGKITNYYSAEQINPNLVTDGGKDNTADCVIVDSAVSSFIENMKTGTVTFDKSTGLCTLSTGEKFYQVSLKEVEGGAQLGKITADFTAKFGAADNNSLANSFITEDFDVELLDEGLRDLFNKGKEFVKSIGKKVIDKFSEIAGKIKTFFSELFSKITSFKKVVDTENDNFIMGLASQYLKNEGKLVEAKQLKSVNEAIIVIAGNTKAQKKLYAEVNSKLSSLIKICNSPGINYSNAGEYGVKRIAKKSLNVNGVRKLMMNIRAFDALTRLIKNSKGKIRSAADIFDELIELEKSMYFGRTSLPLYKVFGLDSAGSGTAYKFLKTGKEYSEEKKKSIKNLDTALVVMVSENKGYATVGTFMLSGMKDSKVQYNQVQFRSNSSTGFSFVIEGSKIVTLEYLKDYGHIA